MIQEKLIGEIVDSLVPKLHELSLGLLVTLLGVRNQGVRMHHCNIRIGLGHGS
jgi:hypothetical protein